MTRQVRQARFDPPCTATTTSHVALLECSVFFDCAYSAFSSRQNRPLCRKLRISLSTLLSTGHSPNCNRRIEFSIAAILDCFDQAT